MKSILSKLFAVNVFVSSTIMMSYAQGSLSGEIRPRTEYRHGFGTLADSAQKPAVFTEQRTRLYFGYKSEFINTKISVQDIRVWGSQTNNVNNDGALTAIHEAWAEAFMSPAFSLKFGRQEIAYDDDRILGSLDWAQQARRHDAAVLKYQDSTFVLHAGVAYNQDKPQSVGTLYTVANYKALQYLWIHKDINTLGLSALFLNNGMQPSKFDSTQKKTIYKDNYSQTAGIRISYKKEKFSAFTYYYHQFGINNDWVNTKINAYDAAAELSYQIIKPIGVSLGFEMLSGNDFTDKSNLDTSTFKNVITQNAFNPFYGTNHKFNGHMDQFYVGNHIGNAGLNDIYVKLGYKHEKFNVGIDAHYFMSNGKVRNEKQYTSDVATAIAAGQKWKEIAIPAMNSNLGTEIDFYCGFNLVKGVMVKGGYSHLLPTETLAIIKGVKNYKGDGRTDQISNWGWVMLIVKPSFL